jgi:hypothetical protein
MAEQRLRVCEYYAGLQNRTITDRGDVAGGLGGLLWVMASAGHLSSNPVLGAAKEEADHVTVVVRDGVVADVELSETAARILRGEFTAEESARMAEAYE